MKKGFLLTEIIMLIFIVAVIAAVLFPLKILDINQAERIAIWKTYYQNLRYCYDVMQQSEKNFVKRYSEDISLSPEAYFTVFSKYLGIDKEKNEKMDFKQYKKRFKNGKKILKESKYFSVENVCLRNGIVVAFSGLQREKPDDAIGLLFIDVDKKIKRNFIGIDIFVVLVYPDRIEPYGYNSSLQELKEDCSPVGSGLKCSAYYLMGGSF
ncbi:MAG: type II secretion system protein [Candidatus Gastranaerophilaceae bacterium]